MDEAGVHAKRNLKIVTPDVPIIGICEACNAQFQSFDVSTRESELSKPSSTRMSASLWPPAKPLAGTFKALIKRR
jgi:hypothetical protein